MSNDSGPIEVEAKVMDLLQEVINKADKALLALAPRWTRVDCTPAEEMAIRELNDAMQALFRENDGWEPR